MDCTGGGGGGTGLFGVNVVQHVGFCGFVHGRVVGTSQPGRAGNNRGREGGRYVRMHMLECYGS